MRLQTLYQKVLRSEGAAGGSTGSGRHADLTAAALDDADEALARGDGPEAVRLLVEANRSHPDPELELRLVDVRHAAVDLVASSGRTPWPPVYPDPFPGVAGRVPEMKAGDLSEDALGGAVAHHGGLIVRGLFDDAQIAGTIEANDRAAARRALPDSESSSDRWYRPFPLDDPKDRALRQLVSRRGGTWLADSPASCAQVLDGLAATGTIDVIASHFGEQPLISLQKSTLRRSLPVMNFTGWHQDGSFLGSQARAMNVWVALTPCGGDRPAPGLQVVPRRIDQILPTDGALGPAAIANESSLAAAGDTPPIEPEFEPGDALLFDEKFLHRTHLTPDMTEERYALECWFFAPAFAAERYVSFMV